MFHYKIILLILFLIVAKTTCYAASNSLTSFQDENILHLSSFTARVKLILKEYFLQNIYLLVIDDEDDSSCKLSDDILKDIHSSTTVSTISLLNFTNVKDFGRFHVQDNIENSVSFIVFQSEILNSCFPYDYWINSNFWNPRAFFLLVITRNVSEKTVTMKNMFEDCWARYSILNMLVVFWRVISLKDNITSTNESRGSKLGIRAMSYNPFTKEVHLNNLSDTYMTLGAFKMFRDKLQDTKGFLLDSPLDYYHPLVIESKSPDGRIILGGPNGKFFTVLIQKMNFTFNIFYLNEDNILNYYDNVNSTTHGLSTHQHFLVRLFNDHKSTYPHDQDCITFIVPRALEIPKYMNIIIPFSATIWLMFVLINLFMAFVWKVLALYNIPGSKIPPQSSVLFETFNMSLGGAPRSLPSLFSQRFLVLMCLVFNLLMNSTYKGLLYSFLTIPMYYPDMNTIMEALDSDLKISAITSAPASKYLLSSIDLTDPYVIKTLSKLVVITDEKKSLEMVAFSRNISRVSPKYTGQIEVNRPEYIRDDRSQLHVVDDCYCTILGTFSSVEEHSPFLAKFTDITMRLQESGFIMKWKKDHLLEGLRTLNRKTHRASLTKLKVENLQTAFYILGSGLSFASLGCFLEVAIYCLFKIC